MSTREERQAYLRRKTEAYIAKHGSMPTCACGCGSNVKMTGKGKPARYLSGHNLRASAGMDHARRAADHWTDENSIDKAKFFAALDEIRRKRGMTWLELSRAAGLGDKAFNVIQYDKRRKHVSKKWAANVLTRLAGGATPPTGHERRMMHRSGW